MSKDPAFLFYSSDFLTGTMFMTNEQVGAYIRLLCAQHQQGHLSEKHMLSICSAHDTEIFAKFKKDERGLYYNDRLDKEAGRRSEYIKSRKINASARYEDKKPPKHMQSTCKAYAEHMENENDNANESRNQNEIEGNQPRVELDVMFDKFYEAYPRKEARTQAEHAFADLIMTDTLFNKMLTAIEQWKKTEQWMKDGGRFVPQPAKWLREGRWEDAIPAPTKQNFAGVTYTPEQLSKFEDDPAELMRQMKEGTC